MIDYREICAICGKTCDVKNHIKEHGLTTKEYYDKYIKKPDEGICKICGGQTPFRGINRGYPQIYCSNKCHCQDPDAKKLHSDQLKNKSNKEKQEIRQKQIEAWEKSMGKDWGKIMAQRSFDSYDKKHPGNKGGPFASKESREKCEKIWGGPSPACNQETKDKISESITEWNKERRPIIEHDILNRYQSKFPNIVDYNIETGMFTYVCPVCGESCEFNKQYIHRRIKYKIDFCYNCIPKSGTSVLEKNLLNYIKEIYSGTILENDKTIIAPKELDIVLPELKLAFEFDGSFWHMDDRIYEATDFNKKKNMTAKEIWDYDLQKIKLCEDVGYKLIRIKELDWVNDSINTKNFIKNLINEVKV